MVSLKKTDPNMLRYKGNENIIYQCQTNVRIYSIQYKVFTVSYHSFNMSGVLLKKAWCSCYHEAMLNICN